VIATEPDRFVIFAVRLPTSAVETFMRVHPRHLAGGLALLTLSYLGYAATTWSRYGRTGTRAGAGDGSLLDRFMPTSEVAERHEIVVAAPAELTMAAAREMDIFRSPLVRAVFAVRTLPARLRGAAARRPAALLSETLALGWRVLADVPGRAIVVGAVTQPWHADVTFRGLEPHAFAAFDEPGYAKIAWTLEAIPLGPSTSRFRTETRVLTTDPRSRVLFRRYWAVFSPGILLIRRASLGLVKADAERRFQAVTRTAAPLVAQHS
jgi:hypothetical protein